MKNSVEKRRKQILDAAEDVFVKHGFASAKTDDIAHLADLGKGTLYRYYKNKKNLFFAVVDRELSELRLAMFQGVNKKTDPVEKIEAAIRTYLSFFDRHPSLMDMIIHEHSSFSDRIGKKYFEHYYGNKSRVVQTFREGIKKGLIKRINIESAISILASILHGTIYTWHAENKRFNLKDRVPAICKVFFSGIIKNRNRRKKYE